MHPDYLSITGSFDHQSRTLGILQSLILVHELLLDHMRLLREILIVRWMVHSRVASSSRAWDNMWLTRALLLHACVSAHLLGIILMITLAHGGLVLGSIVDSLAFHIKLKSVLALNTVRLDKILPIKLDNLFLELSFAKG